MRNYKELLSELKAKGIKPLYGDFYEYEGFPLEKDFEEFYKYCQEYLDRDDLGFKIAPARFYYNTNTSENAVAYVKGEYFLVEIFKGAIFEQHTFFGGKQPLFANNPLREYEEIVAKAGIDASYFVFQFVTLFFLYHEVGHLIQRSVGSSDYTEFAAKDCVGDDIVEKHMREHDADWFASNQLAFHIKELAERCHPTDGDELASISAGLTSLALAGIYCHFIKWAKDYSTIYYQEHCHPHPSIRVMYIIKYLLDTMAVNLPFRLNDAQVLKNAIKISEALMMEPGNNIIKKYSLDLLSQMGKVEDYINKIRKDAETYRYLCHRVVAK
jgi:hypothetical protein